MCGCSCSAAPPPDSARSCSSYPDRLGITPSLSLLQLPYHVTALIVGAPARTLTSRTGFSIVSSFSPRVPHHTYPRRYCLSRLSLDGLVGCHLMDRRAHSRTNEEGNVWFVPPVSTKMPWGV